MAKRNLITAVLVAFAFISGKLVSSRETESAPKESTLALNEASDATSDSASAHKAANEVARESGGNESNNAPVVGKTAAPFGGAGTVQSAPTSKNAGAPPLSSEAAREVLARVSRRDLYQWIAEDEMRLERFKETDHQFPSRKKMSEGDWKRLLDLAAVTGAVRFKFQSAQTSQLKIDFKSKRAELAVRYRKADAKSPDDLSTSRSSWNIDNGRGVGLTSDGAGYFIVIVNPLQEPGWVEYSNFAIPVAFDWSGKSEMTVEVFGLTEDLQWAPLGSAVLKRQISRPF